MGRKAYHARTRDVVWGIVAGSVAMAALAAMVGTSARPRLDWFIYGLAVLLPAHLICWLAKYGRRGAYRLQPGTIPYLVALACACSPFAFLGAAAILLIVWVGSLVAGLAWSGVLLNAGLLAFGATILGNLLCACILNLTLAIQGPGRNQAES